MGLLTYSLLEGMKGPALRDGDFVDVQKLLAHAVDRVSALAGDFGGVQQPRLAVPRGGESFDVGQLTAANRGRISLAEKRPLVLRASFQDDAPPSRDKLRLGNAVNELLREVSARGRRAPLVFIDAEEFSNAYLVAGRYSVAGESIELTVSVSRENEDAQTFEVQGQESALRAIPHTPE